MFDILKCREGHICPVSIFFGITDKNFWIHNWILRIILPHKTYNFYKILIILWSHPLRVRMDN